MTEHCVFCKIVEGTIPSTRLFESSDVLAFMDIGPIIKGHVLVIPKAHHERLPEVPAALLGQVMEAVQRVAVAQVKGLGADGINVHQSNGAAAGQVVPHVHFHVIPRFDGDGHRWNWASKTYDNSEELKRVADKIRSALL